MQQVGFSPDCLFMVLCFVVIVAVVCLFVVLVVCLFVVLVVCLFVVLVVLSVFFGLVCLLFVCYIYIYIYTHI